MLRLGIAHHFGWAVAVVAAPDGAVVDRRRIELVEPGTPVAPYHHDGEGLDDDAFADLVASVRASSVRAVKAAFDALPSGIASISLRAWDDDFPTDLDVLRRVPYEARADSVMYREVLAEVARERGWSVHTFDTRELEARAADLVHLRDELGPPWTKDHRVALAATMLVEG